MIEILTYAVGWLLFVFAQAQNSVRSNSNGLQGSAGFLRWLQFQTANLATRAFLSTIFYGWAVQFVTARLKAVGLSLDAAGIAGLAGYAINALLYQVQGYIPWLRVEIGDLAPPAPSAKEVYSPEIKKELATIANQQQLDPPAK